MKSVNFTQMKDGTKEEYLFLREFELEHVKGAADRVLRELGLQSEETLPGYKITRLEHGLQAATRAFREGADIDWVAAAVLHDTGDRVAPENHDQFAAEIGRPLLRERFVGCVVQLGSCQIVGHGQH